jgi:Tol biopolymer transport system component
MARSRPRAFVLALLAALTLGAGAIGPPAAVTQAQRAPVPWAAGAGGPAAYKLVVAAYSRAEAEQGAGFQDLFTVNADGTNLKRLRPLGDGFYYDWPSWAVNGTKIVFSARRTVQPGSPEALYMMNADGTGVVQLTFNDWRNGQPKVSPDGESIVFTSAWKEFPLVGIYRLRLHTGEVENLSTRTVGAYNDSDPRWTADGRRIVFASLPEGQDDERPTQVFAMNADGTGRERITTEQHFDTDPAFSPDGRWLAVSSYRGPGHPVAPEARAQGLTLEGQWRHVRLADWRLVLRNLATGTEQALTEGQDCLVRPPQDACRPAEGPAWVPVWLPDGKGIAYISGRSIAATGVYLADPGGGGARPVIEAPGMVINWHDWAPVSQPASPATPAAPLPAGRGAPVLLYGGPVYGELAPGAAPPVPQLFKATADRWVSTEIPLVDPDGRTLSPDTARWVAGRVSVVVGASIWEAGETPRPEDPQPDGQEADVADEPGDRPGRRQIFLVDAEGGPAHQLTTPATEDPLEPIPDDEARDNVEPDVSPDGRYVVFTNRSRALGRSWLLRLDLVTGDVLNLSSLTRGNLPGGDAQPRYSPDGRRIAFVASEGGAGQVFTVGADGEDARRVTDDDTRKLDPSWSPDGRSLVYTAFRGAEGAPAGPPGRLSGEWSLERRDVQTGARVVLLRTDLPLMRPVWSPDGSRIAYIAFSSNQQPDIHVVDAGGGDPHPLAVTLRTREAFVDWK